MKHNNIFLAIAISMICCCGCSSNEPEIASEIKEISLSVEEKVLVIQENDFAMTMFATFGDDENFVFSPLSAACNMSLVANASDGATRTQYLNALGFENIDDLNSFNQKILKYVKSLDNDKVKMSLANSIWTNKLHNVTLDNEFSSIAKKYYNSDVTSLAFASDTYKKVNKWVSNNTKGLITDFYDEGEISISDYVVLVNALHFKGEFTKKFDSSKTKVSSFYPANGIKTQVNYMRSTRDVPYFDDPLAKGISLDYGNGAFEIVFVLPQNGSTLQIAAEKAMQISELKTTKVEISLPKCKLNSYFRLNGVYQKLGIETEASNLVHIIANGQPINNIKLHIKQKTLFEIDENGSEGASATGTTGVGALATDIPKFEANRPFVFMVREKSTGIILFMGAYVK